MTGRSGASLPARPISGTTDASEPDKPARRDRRGEARRTAIIDAARELLIERGYRHTTLSQIIARAGGSRETIYQTMGGKSGILGAIVAAGSEKVAASVLAPVWRDRPPREALTRIGRRLAEIWHGAEAIGIHRIVLSEGLESPEIVAAWYQGGTAITVAALALYLAARMDAGQLKRQDADLVARQFVFLLAGELSFPFIAGCDHAVAADVHVQRCVDLILAAYGIEA